MFVVKFVYGSDKMKRLLTGLKPTGNLTLGNYIGAIKPLVDLANTNEYEILLFVADLHALTVYQEPDLLRDRIKKFIAMYLACGVDPSKVTIYIQSDNTYIPAISWLLECNTYYGEARAIIQAWDEQLVKIVAKDAENEVEAVIPVKSEPVNVSSWNSR